MNSGDGLNLFMAFDTDDHEFVRGFEVGRIHAGLERGDRGPFIVHASNAEMVLRLAEAHEMKVVAHDLDDAFIEVRFSGEGDTG